MCDLCATPHYVTLPSMHRHHSGHVMTVSHRRHSSYWTTTNYQHLPIHLVALDSLEYILVC